MMSPRPTPPVTPLTPRHRSTRSISSRFPSIFTSPKPKQHSTSSSTSSISTIASLSSTSSDDVNKSLLPERTWRKQDDDDEEKGRRVKWLRSRRGVAVVVCWIAGVLVVCWFGLELSRSERVRLGGWRDVFRPSASESVGLKAEDVTDADLEAVAVLREDGTKGWSFNLPKGLEGVLRQRQYGKMCASAQGVPGMLHDEGHGGHAGHSHRDYYWADPEFVDPDGRTNVGEREEEVCASSLTYLLGEQDISIGGALMGMWLAYGLAVRERRAFFVESENWIYGSLDTYLTPPPSPPCRRPPPQWTLPCPRTSRHLLMTSTTASHNLGHAFIEEYEDPKAMDVFRQRHIFALARAGYEALFKPSIEIETAAKKRLTKVGGTGEMGAVVQVRRGEVHPYSFAHRWGYIPLETYLEAAANKTDGVGKVVAMGDDPASFDGLEGLEASSSGTGMEPPRLEPPAHGEEESEVERMYINGAGFYGRVFRELGEDERRAWGKSAVLDLAVAKMVLEGADGKATAVCGLKSYMCRLLGVMVGWDRGIVEGGWINIDGEWGWRGWEW